MAAAATRVFLQGVQDPDRPEPTRVFKDHETLQVGSMTADLQVGHWHSPDVELARAYVDDVIGTVARIVRQGDTALVARAVQTYGRENTYATARVLIDHEVDQCARELIGRWHQRLDDVDVWASSHCRTALVYVEWDVGPHGHLR